MKSDAVLKRSGFGAMIGLVVLLLSGCASESGGFSGAESSLTSEAVPTPESKPKILQVGQTAMGICPTESPCEIDVTVTKLEAFYGCRVTNDHSNQEDRSEVENFLEIEAEVKVTKSAEEASTVALRLPDVVLENDTIVSAPRAENCGSDAEYTWEDEIGEGKEAKVNGVFLIPVNAEFLTIGNGKWKIPEINSTMELSTQPDSVRLESTVQSESVIPTESASDASGQEVASIFNEPGVGYQCAATDAWVDDPALCTAENLGGDPSYDLYWGPNAAMPAEQALRDPSTIPYSEGGTCSAAECGYGTDEFGNDLNQLKIESHTWWADCIAANEVEFCRANDPYQ
ncbi:hypothetical protein ACXZ66_11800 [Corynebacterium sp. S7]